MSEASTETAGTESEAVQGNPGEEALGDAGKQALDRMKAERNEAKQTAAALQKQLDDINAANLTDLEKAQAKAAAFEKDANDAKAEALRFRVAAKHGISDEDADLFLTGSDADTLERQAARLMERAPTSPKPDHSQGARGGEGNPTTGDQFASVVGPMFTT